MKRLFILMPLILFISVTSKSTTIPLDSIKKSVILFLKEVENIDYSIKSLDFLIVDCKTKKPIKEGKDGVFFFNMLGTGSNSYTHFILVEKDSFQIINMEYPLDQNILKLIAFFERNRQYSRKDVLFYIKDFINRYQRDKKRIHDHLIFPRLP